MARCLVIVSRDQPELFQRLTSIYEQEEWIDILLDRRRGAAGLASASGPERRSSPRAQTDLREHGYIAIPDLPAERL